VDYSPGYAPTMGRDQTATLFGQVMALVALAGAFFVFGAYAGRNISPGWGIAWFFIAFGCLIAMNFTVRRASSTAGVVLLIAVGLFLGLAMGPTVHYYASVNPQVVWQAGGATALFMAGFGAAGYATRRDLSAIGRFSFFALIALIVAGIVLIFVHIPGAYLAYCIIGLVIFAGLTMYDFQRLRQARNITSAPLLAASIFLDGLNVFLFFLRIFGGGRD
jgi:FtsH-binding integral membrane protein